MMLDKDTPATGSTRPDASPAALTDPPQPTDELRYQVVAELAHDLNNLLTPIVALSACLEMDLQGATAQELARDIRITAERASRFVKRALTSLQDPPPAADFVHAGTVIMEMRELIRNIAGPRISVEVRVARGTGLVLLEKSRLEATLIDLVANARDAIDEHGTISVKTSAVILDAGQARALGLLAAGEYVVIEVSDSGRGVPPRLLPRIFERCFTTKPAGEGSGLGLHHVKRFVMDSQGAISVQSAEQQGTTFALHFPRVAATKLRPG